MLGRLKSFNINLDYMFLTLLIGMATLQPYFMHGGIIFHEAGIYLPCIDAIFKGEFPYRDIFVYRGPFEIYIPIFLMNIFGKSIIVLRGYFYIGTVLTLIICVFLGKQLYRLRSFSYFMALVLTAKTFARVSFADWGGIRFGMGILALLITVIFLRREKPLLIFLAGVISGFALFISFEIGLFSAAAIIVTLILYWILGFSRMKYRAIILFSIGFSMVAIPWLIYFYVNKALLPYFDTIIKVARDGTKVFDVPAVQGSPRNIKEFIAALSPFNHNIKYMQPFFLYLGVSIYFIWKFLKRRFNIRDLMVMCVTIYGIFMYYGAFRDIEGPQFKMALQPAIIVLYVFLENLYIFSRNSRVTEKTSFRKILIYFIIVTIPVFSIVYPLRRYKKRFFIFKYAKEFFIEKKGRDILFPKASHSALELDRAKGIIVPDWQRDELIEVTQYIKENTTQDDILFTYPDVGAYNFLTDRPALGRFKTSMFSWMQVEWHRELMDDLRTKRPRHILHKKKYPQIEPYLPRVKPYREEMYNYIRENYKIVKDIGNIEIYQLNE